MKKMTGVEEYFHSKRRYAESEISDDAMVLALTYRKKTRHGTVLGTYIITKIKAEIDKIQPVGMVASPDGPGEKLAPFLLAGCGNYTEFDDFVTASKRYVSNTIHEMGDISALSTESLVKTISNKFRHAFVNGRKAYGTELMVVSFLSGAPEIYRIKYTGEFHPCSLYAVIGGYNSLNSKKGSLRKKALAELKKLYSGKKLPSQKTVKKLAEQLMALERDKGEEIEANFLSAESLSKNAKESGSNRSHDCHHESNDKTEKTILKSNESAP